MNGVMLKDILSLQEMKDVKVIAGEKGLNRVVKNVNIMEVPDIGDWIKEGELLLTTGFAIKDDLNAQQKLIPLLNSKNLAGLAIKPKRYINDINKTIIDIANALDFPLMEFPFYMSYSDLILPILNTIINHQAMVLNKIEYAHNKIMDILVNNGDIPQIAETMRKLVGNPVIIKDICGNILASTLNEEENKEINRRETAQEEESIKITKLPIIAQNEILGHIYCYEMYHGLTKVDLMSLHRAAALVTLELVNREKIKVIAKRYKNEFLMELLNGNMVDEQYIIKRGLQLEWDLNQEMSVMLIDINFLKKYPNETSQIESIINKVYSMVQTIVEGFNKNPIIGTLGSTIILLIPVKKVYLFFSDISSNALIKLGHYIKKLLLQQLSQIEINIGIGKTYSSCADFSKSYEEAKKSLQILKAMYCDNKVIYYENLGMYKLFHNLSHEGINFVKEILFPIIEYDEKREGNLMETLEAYFKYNGNIKLVAQQLYIHYNTAIYRMEQIQKLLKLDFNNPDDRLNIEMALKLKNFISAK